MSLLEQLSRGMDAPGVDASYDSPVTASDALPSEAFGGAEHQQAAGKIQGVFRGRQARKETLKYSKFGRSRGAPPTAAERRIMEAERHKREFRRGQRVWALWETAACAGCGVWGVPPPPPHTHHPNS